MKDSRRNKIARELKPKVSASVFKTSVFPVLEPDNDVEERPVPLTYSENEDIILPEDYRPTKCKAVVFDVVYNVDVVVNAPANR